ncbi:hypothetical protein HYU14_00050 [Candidatus Woesearchaeota archaeon]|nr:hypothetical protein [Candidatus Woesearchaeota archaeon]
MVDKYLMHVVSTYRPDSQLGGSISVDPSTIDRIFAPNHSWKSKVPSALHKDRFDLTFPNAKTPEQAAIAQLSCYQTKTMQRVEELPENPGGLLNLISSAYAAPTSISIDGKEVSLPSYSILVIVQNSREAWLLNPFQKEVWDAHPINVGDSVYIFVEPLGKFSASVRSQAFADKAADAFRSNKKFEGVFPQVVIPRIREGLMGAHAKNICAIIDQEGLAGGVYIKNHGFEYLRNSFQLEPFSEPNYRLVSTYKDIERIQAHQNQRVVLMFKPQKTKEDGPTLKNIHDATGRIISIVRNQSSIPSEGKPPTTEVAAVQRAIQTKRGLCKGVAEKFFAKKGRGGK